MAGLGKKLFLRPLPNQIIPRFHTIQVATRAPVDKLHHGGRAKIIIKKNLQVGAKIWLSSVRGGAAVKRIVVGGAWGFLLPIKGDPIKPGSLFLGNVCIPTPASHVEKRIELEGHGARHKQHSSGRALRASGGLRRKTEKEGFADGMLESGSYGRAEP